MDKKTRQQIALFRHGLIGDLVHRKVGERGLYALLRDAVPRRRERTLKAERVYEIPGCSRSSACSPTTTWTPKTAFVCYCSARAS